MQQKSVKKTANPAPPELPEAIGPYSILRSVGRGGMGEVYLAKDPSCGRELALKRIRPDLSKNQTILNRFLREARVASRLTHPSIVPILAITNAPPDFYYTMPYVEGDTLRQILRDTLEKGGAHPIGRSIPSLARIFLQICEAIAYTHSKGILHRDLKPENIIVGKYGEVMILDWGIADFITSLKTEKEDDTTERVPCEEDLTRPGKIAGTLAYMAPERLSGENSSVQADIYALGVMLYYMLTLQVPFQRKTLAQFRKQAQNERLVEPIEAAPYRDIPQQLSAICSKCLAYSQKDRFASVEELIAEIKSYIEGQARWIPVASLDSNKADEWQFQENVLPAKHIAIARDLDETQWAALMISRKSFASNVKLETKACLQPGCRGFGLLFSVPGPKERKMLEEGYCLWLSQNECRLYRHNVQIFSAPRGLETGKLHRCSIEKVEDVLKFYLDDILIFTYTSHLPLVGAHVGLLQKDSLFEIEPIVVSDASHNAYVRCLAVPNAFLSHKLYDLALAEYRRIGQSFPGRQEGREGLFRAGIALLEKGKMQTRKQKREEAFHGALKEFGNLYRTSGAPLEYLGKSFVYDAMGDNEEEAKCLELALRKFPKHPLLTILKEHIVYRMHESSQTRRDAAYRIILLAIRHIPDVLENNDTKALIDSLQRNLEELPFFEKVAYDDFLAQISIQLAFWLAKPMILAEIAENLAKAEHPSETLIENALFCLLELDAHSLLEKPLSALNEQAKGYFQSALSHTLPPTIHSSSRKDARLLCYLMRKALAKKQMDKAKEIEQAILQQKWQKKERTHLEANIAWLYLLERDFEKAETLFRSYKKRDLNQEQSPLHFPYGCYLYATMGREIAQLHFAGVLDTPYPSTTAIPSHFLLGKINGKKGWIERAFWWEKKELHRQLDFFYQVIGKKKK